MGSHCSGSRFGVGFYSAYLVSDKALPTDDVACCGGSASALFLFQHML